MARRRDQHQEAGRAAPRDAVTHATFLVSTLAITGIVPLSASSRRTPSSTAFTHRLEGLGWVNKVVWGSGWSPPSAPAFYMVRVLLADLPRRAVAGGEGPPRARERPRDGCSAGDSRASSRSPGSSRAFRSHVGNATQTVDGELSFAGVSPAPSSGAHDPLSTRAAESTWHAAPT